MSYPLGGRGLRFQQQMWERQLRLKQVRIQTRKPKPKDSGK